MKILFGIFFLLIFLYSTSSNFYAMNNGESFSYSVIRDKTVINANNISTWIWNTGVFNQDLIVNTLPGFEWPKGSGKFAIFSSGLTIGAYVNDEIRFASVYYGGEYAPGYSSNSTGYTDSTFKLYKVARGDNNFNNPDYANWWRMIPFGAPFDDINNNGIFDSGIDKPGVKLAAQTIFICMTDAFPENHTTSTGFAGGTLPLYSEKHLTAWCYDNVGGLEDVQFLKMEIINKSLFNWSKAYFAIICDPDLGEPHDDFTGCDTIRNLGYCYNADNQDDNGSGRYYGTNPPAVGFDFLKSAVNRSITPNAELKMSSFHFFQKSSQPGPSCESEIINTSLQGYNYIKGLKKDSTPFINPLTMQPTKFVYSGDPELETGWTQYKGKISNCEGITTGYIDTAYAGEIRFVMSSGADNLTIIPGEKQTFVIAQMIARGNNNLNSVTKLKQLDDFVQTVYDNNFVIGINPVSSIVPDNFKLYQNYPNPFNPETKIKFDVSLKEFVNLSVYDITGKLITNLVNESLSAGTYEVNFSAANLPSGVYFCKLSSSSSNEIRKMILTK